MKHRSPFVLLMLVAMLISACASPAAPATPAPQPAAPTAAPSGGQLVLKLATTTSTQDSGLLDVILPDFQKLV